MGLLCQCVVCVFESVCVKCECSVRERVGCVVCACASVHVRVRVCKWERCLVQKYLGRSEANLDWIF